MNQSISLEFIATSFGNPIQHFRQRTLCGSAKSNITCRFAKNINHSSIYHSCCPYSIVYWTVVLFCVFICEKMSDAPEDFAIQHPIDEATPRLMWKNELSCQVPVVQVCCVLDVVRSSHSGIGTWYIYIPSPNKTIVYRMLLPYRQIHLCLLLPTSDHPRTEGFFIHHCSKSMTTMLRISKLPAFLPRVLRPSFFAADVPSRFFASDSSGDQSKLRNIGISAHIDRYALHTFLIIFFFGCLF